MNTNIWLLIGVLGLGKQTPVEEMFPWIWQCWSLGWGGVGGSQQYHNPPDVPLRSPHSPPPPKPAVCPQNTPSVTADMWKDSKELRAV